MIDSFRGTQVRLRDHDEAGSGHYKSCPSGHGVVKSPMTRDLLRVSTPFYETWGGDGAEVMHARAGRS